MSYQSEILFDYRRCVSVDVGDLTNAYICINFHCIVDLKVGEPLDFKGGVESLGQDTVFSQAWQINLGFKSLVDHVSVHVWDNRTYTSCLQTLLESKVFGTTPEQKIVLNKYKEQGRAINLHLIYFVKQLQSCLSTWPVYQWQ